MKNLLTLFCFLAFSITLSAQCTPYDRYTVSGGLLGALNYDEFIIGGDNNNNFDYERKIGWSAGAWLNLPIARGFSLEPQVMYSVYKYQAVEGTPLLTVGTVNYLQVPILLKFDLWKSFALTLGPQVDFTMGLDAYPSSLEKDHLASVGINSSLGLEILPHAPITPYIRWVHGFTNMDDTGLDNGDAKYYNDNVQFGVKIRLFGKVIPADTDCDGIPDKDDKCPVDFGYERYMGCPIPDTDGDGINDEVDKCPRDFGFERYDGCPIPDSDGDGLNDEEDKCPNQAGLARYNGCPIPDSDGDGFNDEEDKCPNVRGVAAYNGCPIPDADGDGINDADDKCPNQAGLAMFGGCPDRDKDGIMDSEDFCPDLPGPKETHGCPKIENAKFSPKMIQFVTGSSKLTAKSIRDIKEGALLLNSDEFKSLKVELQGHTDSTGDDESNMTLSQKRAESVMAELIRDGVDPARLTAKGYGETRPIADNATSEGRALNRRTEFEVRQ